MKNTKEIPNEQKRTLIYCRESRDDYGNNYERIETQRDLLLKFCKDNGYTNIVDVVMHDDMSGTDFTRLEDIKKKIINGEIDVLVMKDSSRLGRNQLESLKFIELLEKHKVELVFEGRSYDEDFFPLEAWFNERRAKDDSRKIRTNLKHKMEEGKLLIRAHYGYKKEGNKLIVDNEVAWIVSKIFNLYLEGYGYRAIATKLNNENIPTPSQYRSCANTPIANNWIAQHIKRVLENEVYTGCMISGTTEKISFKSKVTRRKSKDEWIKVENTHESIIDKETFNAVQDIIKKKQVYAPKSITPCKYAGLLYCGKCSSPLYFIKRKDKPDNFICSRYHKEGKVKSDNPNRGCETHSVRYEFVEKFITNHTKHMLDEYNDDYRDYANERLKDFDSVKVNNQKRLSDLKSKLNTLKSQYSQVYNDKLNGIVPEFIYVEKSKELSNNITIAEKEIERLIGYVDQYNEIKNRIEDLNEAFTSLKEGGFSKEALQATIDKVIIYDKNEITPDDKHKYNLNDERYNSIYENGGAVISYYNDLQHVFTSRWLRDWS